MWGVCFCFLMWVSYIQVDILNKSELRRELCVENLFGVSFSKVIIIETTQLEAIARKSDQDRTECLKNHQNLKESL